MGLVDCKRFLLQLDESTDVSDTAQLCIFRYDCDRGAVNNTAHERTQAGRGRFFSLSKKFD